MDISVEAFNTLEYNEHGAPTTNKDTDKQQVFLVLDLHNLRMLFSLVVLTSYDIIYFVFLPSSSN